MASLAPLTAHWNGDPGAGPGSAIATPVSWPASRPTSSRLGVPCLDETTVLAFLDGTLPAPARAETQTHLASCPACIDLTTWAAADLANGSRAPGREGRPFIGQLAPGARVGRYQIVGALGRGGMGEVYAAYHPELDRRIALKVVHEAGVDSAERQARLLREARAIARLSHPNVVAVHDAGTVGGRVFIAMELVEGETVDIWLRSAKRSRGQILDVFLAAGRGLAAVHAAGIVHRDFKPQNVMVGRDGVVRLMDFGLARLVGDKASDAGIEVVGNESCFVISTVTRTGALLGTPAYMSPEQLRGEPADARTDQFSFCAALYEALCGVRWPAAARGPRSRLPRAVLRGLHPDGYRRFESMPRLLAAIARGAARFRTLRPKFDIL